MRSDRSVRSTRRPNRATRQETRHLRSAREGFSTDRLRPGRGAPRRCTGAPRGARRRQRADHFAGDVLASPDVCAQAARRPGVVAAPRGFEPRLTDPKSAVLPLDEGAGNPGVDVTWGGSGAEDGTRTRDPHLGKVMLYQLSHFRSMTDQVLVPRARIRTGDTAIFSRVLYQLSYLGPDPGPRRGPVGAAQNSTSPERAATAGGLTTRAGHSPAPAPLASTAGAAAMQAVVRPAVPNGEEAPAPGSRARARPSAHEAG